MIKFMRVFCIVALLFVLVSGITFAAAASKSSSNPSQEAQKRFSKGIEYQRAGKLDNAIAEYRAVNKLAPKFVPAFVNLGLAYIGKNQAANAESAFMKALAVEPKNELAMEQLTRVLLARGKGNEALTLARKFLGQKPKDPERRLLFGMANLQVKDYDAAVDAFRSTIHADPDNELAHMNLAMCYSNLKKHGDALQTMERFLKTKPDHGQARMLAAYSAEQIGDKTLAAKHYEAASEIKPVAVSALMNLARLYRAMEKPDKSYDAMKRVLKIDKNNFDANFNLGAYEYGKGHYKEAEGYWTAARKARPDEPGVNVNLAMVCARQEKYAEALPFAAAAVKADPKNVMALEVYGFALERGNKIDEALGVYRKWEKYHPKDHLPNTKIAMIRLHQGKQNEAWTEFEAALKKAPEDIDLLNSYADVARMNTQFAKAYSLYDKALKLKPGVVPTMLNAAFCLRKQNKLDEAAALLEKAVGADPKSEPARTNLAEIYEAQDKADLAIEQYKSIIEADPKSTRALTSLARLYDRQKNYDAEVEIYRKLAEIDPENQRFMTMIPNIYEKAGKLDLAIVEARKLVASDGKNTSYRGILGNLLEKQQDYPAALEQYSEMAKSEDAGTKAYAFELTGKLHDAQNRPDDAIAAYKKALEVRPDNTAVLNALAGVYEAQNRSEEFLGYLKSLIEPGVPDLPYRFFLNKFRAAGKEADAISTLEGITAKNPDTDQAVFVLASAYAGAGQKEKSIEQYSKVIAKKPEDPWANRELGDLYKSMQRYQEAEKHYAIAAKTMSWDRAVLLSLAEVYEKLGREMDALKVYNDYLKVDPANEEIKKKVRSMERVKTPAAPEPEKQ